MERITAEQLQERADCVIVDVREYPEFARGAIPGARLVPLGTLQHSAEEWDRGCRYVMVCKSGKRSEQAASTLKKIGFQNIAMLHGGTDAWISAGFPVQGGSSRVWSLERQVRTIAGTLILTFTIAGITISHWFLGATLFVGAGLTVAGVFDVCLMAKILGKMPWNQARIEHIPPFEPQRAKILPNRG